MSPDVLAAPSTPSVGSRNSGVPIVRRVDGCRDLLALHHLNPQRYPFLLESVTHGASQGRFDILFAFPGESLACSLGDGTDFLRELDARWLDERIAVVESDDLLPFRGGWFLYLGYELAAQIEPRLGFGHPAGSLPTAFATRIPAAVICDHHNGHTWLLAETGTEGMLDLMMQDLHAARSPSRQISAAVVSRLEEEPAERYLQAVERIKRYILDGDVFQVNLSRLWQGELQGDRGYTALYQALRRRNPAPFAGLATWRDTTILSSSPERLLRVRGDWLSTRPIAGTRPRSRERRRDTDFSRELLAHPKERAEHIMLIDLERNDLGRVCVPGSVRVDELMTLESYAHVHHIVSNVKGRKRQDATPGQIIAAVFPGGTITGCPKVRCMEIIAELEESARGPYTGSFGYLNRDGDMDLNILIRTMVTQGSRFSLRAGAGIVADSEPAAELAETRAKARGMLLALGIEEEVALR